MLLDPHQLPAVGAEVAHRTATVDGYRLHYAEAGEGEPLVLVHGWPQHWWSWRHVIGPLAESHRVIVPDIRGLGWSEGPGASSRMGDYSLHRLASDVALLLGALGIRRARYVGHDWGCVVGYRLCISRPDLIERAVMLAGVHPWATFSPPRIYLRPYHLWLYGLLGSAGTSVLHLPEHCLHTWRHVGRFTDEEVEAYAERMRRPGVPAATRAFDRNVLLREIPYYTRHHRSIRLRVPVLHLNGAEDPLTAGLPRPHPRFADDHRLELVPDCGHFLAEERPDELLDRLTEFLGQTSS